MNRSTTKVGRITVAVGLVGFGAALLVDNLVGDQSGLTFLLKLWPLILVGFGTEYLVRTALLQQAKVDTRLRFDIGGAFLLLLIGLFAISISMFHSLVSGGLDTFGVPFFNIGATLSRSDGWNIPAQGVSKLVTDVNVGSVSIERGSRTDTIRVEATYSANGFFVDRSAVQQQLDSIKMDVEQGQVVRLIPQIPDRLSNPAIKYVIYAPPGLDVQASTGTGWISVTGYQGDLDLNSRVGWISVDASSGSLNASSGSGYIAVRNFEGPISARTTVGALQINNVKGDTQLDSGTGTISVNDFQGGKLVAESKTGSARAITQTPLEGDVLLRTQTGTVSLTAPKESSMRVTAQTRTGGMAMPSFMNLSHAGASSSAVGATGDGKYTVTLEATTGTVNFDTP